MDTAVYSNYSLNRATIILCRKIKRENPALWAQIQAEAAEKAREKEENTSCAR